MEIQKRIIGFVTRVNWGILLAMGLFGWALAPSDVTSGLILGGLLVTVNFHLLARTLKRTLTPPRLASPNAILAKYYVRFVITGVLIFILIKWRLVDPVGLVLGLSVVVASLMLATALEIKKLIFKEAL